MRNVITILRRELASYFSTPLAYVFLVTFLSAAAALTFYVGGLFERRQADLVPFFDLQPWLFLVLVPAVGMRLWSEERRSGTIELLMALPITTWQAVTGKFLAAWIFTGLALLLTFPIWITINFLGQPDNGVVLASYFGSFLMAGALLALSSCASAMTKSQVIAFVVSVAGGFVLMVSGLDWMLGILRGWAPAPIVDLIASFSLLTHFADIAKGLLDIRGIVFFVSLTALFLFINSQILELKKA